MFSTMQNQRKAQELVEQAKNLVREADARFEELREKLQSRIGSIDAIRSNLVGKTLEMFRHRFEKIENEPEIELAPVAPESVAQQAQVFFERAEVEPVRIGDAGSGKGGAFFGSLIVTVLVLLAVWVVGAVMTHQPLQPETLLDPDKLNTILTWAGGGALPGRVGDPMIGIGVAALLAIIVWMVTWSIMMGKASRKNLAVAEAAYAAAEGYRDEKERYSEAAETLEKELASLQDVLETCDIYLQEYNAVLQRILHTEGSDYETYKVHSKEVIGRAASCALAAVPLLNIAVVTTEGRPSMQLRKAVEEGEKVVVALVEEHAILIPDMTVVEEEAVPMEEAKEETEPEMEEEAGTSVEETPSSAEEDDATVQPEENTPSSSAENVSEEHSKQSSVH